jgi:hypothetical protein
MVNFVSIDLVRKIRAVLKRVTDSEPSYEKRRPAEPLSPIHSFDVGFRATTGGAAK